MSCLLIAEVGQAHDGSLGAAHAYVDAAAAAGANVIKFQTHIAEAESHPSEPWRVRFSKQDASRYEYWRRMEFTSEQWRDLYQHARSVGLEFMSSPFSTEAVDMLADTGIDAWKIASGEVTNTPLLERVRRQSQPVFLSTGMSSLTEISRAVSILDDPDSPVTLMQCTSQYPCPPRMIGLNQIAELRSRFGLGVGLSDHSGTVFAGLAAATLGAVAIEVHVTMSRLAFGPDVSSSITIEELELLARGLAFVSEAMDAVTDKDDLAHDLEPVRSLFMRSIVTVHPIQAGHVFTASDLTLKKPGTGMAADLIDRVVGKRSARDLPANSLLAASDLEGGL